VTIRIRLQISAALDVCCRLVTESNGCLRDVVGILARRFRVALSRGSDAPQEPCASAAAYQRCGWYVAETIKLDLLVLCDV
jgi:hypothetical protein